MQNYLKNHSRTRIILITLFFLIGLVLVFFGWSKSGEGVGLLIQLLGTALLLTSLFCYNALYKDPKRKKK